jgi:hypothetical protein
MTENDLEAGDAGAAIPIYRVRNVDIVVDADLARLYGIETKRLNEQVKRNAERFDGGFAFQATKDEVEVLRSQIATANRVRGSGGRRSPPWVFTEHGVVMAASVVNSPRAIDAMRLVVRVFIAAKNQALAGTGSALVVAPEGGTLVPTERAGTSLAGLGGAWDTLGPKLQRALDQVLDSVVDHRRQSTVREEAQNLISDSIQNLKERLAKPGLENAELAAKAAKLLAEAEERKSVAAKTHAEAEAIEFSTIIKKLRLLLEAEKAMRAESPDAFLEVLREMGSS